MGVRSGRVRVADLEFRVLGGQPHPDWFAVRGHRRVAGRGWVADIRIIEGGHLILWSSGPDRLAEVLSGQGLTFPETGLIERSGVRGERGFRVRPGKGPDYQSCIGAERLDPEVFAHLADELTLDATPGDLFHRGEPEGRLDPAPLSRIHVEARGDGLSVQAFHTFPADRAIVRSQSLFEIRPPRAR